MAGLPSAGLEVGPQRGFSMLRGPVPRAELMCPRISSWRALLTFLSCLLFFCFSSSSTAALFEECSVHHSWSLQGPSGNPLPLLPLLRQLFSLMHCSMWHAPCSSGVLSGTLGLWSGGTECMQMAFSLDSATSVLPVHQV